MIPKIRLGLSALGLVLAIAAIATENRNITWAAIGVLAAAVGLRFLPRPRA
jgi:hypothetical protein